MRSPYPEHTNDLKCRGRNNSEPPSESRCPVGIVPFIAQNSLDSISFFLVETKTKCVGELGLELRSVGLES